MPALSTADSVLQLARELEPGKTVATVVVDTGLKYLAGDLFTGARAGRVS